MPRTPVAINKTSTPDHQCGTLAANGTTPITNATVVNIGGVINTVGEFVRAGVMRKTANGYSHAVENDPNMLSIHSTV